MADSRIPRVPPSAVEPTLRVNVPEDSRSVRIVSLPERLYDVQKAAILRGEVIRREGDSAVRILTDQGEVSVESDRPLNLEKGERVEIRVPPGRPPRTADLRPAPPERDIPRTSQTEIEVRLERPQTAPANEQAYSPEVLRDRIVRAVAVSDPEAVRILPVEPDIVQTSLDSAAFSARKTVQVAEQEIFELLKSLTVSGAGLNGVLKPEAFFPLPVSLGTPERFSLPGGSLPAASTLEPALTRITKSLLLLTPSSLQVPVADFRLSFEAPPLPESLTFRITQTESSALFFLDDPQRSEVSGLISPLRAGDALAVVLGPIADKAALAVQIIFPAGAAPQTFALLDIPVIPPQGTQISLSPVNAPSALLTTLLAPAAPLFTLAAETWPVLQEMLTILPQVAPQAAQAFVNMLPSPSNPQNLAPTALFFIAAVRAGDVEGWLGGKAVDALRRSGRGDVLSRFSQEMSGLSRAASEPVGQDWKALSLPLYWQNQLLKVPVFYRQDQDSRSGQNGEKGSTRFIINLDLSRMGKIQMDALYLKGAKRFDLILRTEQAFSKAMEQEMRGLFTEALAEVSLTGGLIFQTGADQWVTVQADKAYSFSANY
ncbi:MAG: hypothetical protein IPH06_10745 [Alphaproteobacteria bacterium]|nr:hypothetical protein [Alphaproteobacteria bacterium]QQS58461.1 MAG: hypothetical protein IPN28_06500 [Alphaproteobacteria bacterium]